MQRLTGKVALVTGAASGLGLATSQALLAAGVGPRLLDTVLRPFLSGVFLEDELGGELPKLQAAGMIEIVPLAVMRGRTFHDTFVIADEMQGATYKQLKMFFTRTGEGSRVAVTGDVGQSDLKLRKGEEVPLARAVRQVQAHPKNPAAVLDRKSNV